MTKRIHRDETTTEKIEIFERYEKLKAEDKLPKNKRN